MWPSKTSLLLFGQSCVNLYFFETTHFTDFINPRNELISRKECFSENKFPQIHANLGKEEIDRSGF